MTGIRVVPLTCPDCRSDLAGGEGSRLFFCRTCQAALEPRADGWRRERLAFAAPDRGDGGEPFFLPFWLLDVAVGLETADPKKRKELDERAPAIDRVFVTAFAMRNALYYGDPGLALTQAGAAWTKGPGGPLAGVTVGKESAHRIARFHVLSLVDRAVDVTGVEAAVSVNDTTLLGVPFFDRGETLACAIADTDFSRRILSDPPCAPTR